MVDTIIMVSMTTVSMTTECIVKYIIMNISMKVGEGNFNKTLTTGRTWVVVMMEVDLMTEVDLMMDTGFLWWWEGVFGLFFLILKGLVRLDFVPLFQHCLVGGGEGNEKLIDFERDTSDHFGRAELQVSKRVFFPGL